MPEAEQLVMCMADDVGIKTVLHALVKQNDSIAYITKRVDRQASHDHILQKLAMEDFCQLDYKRQKKNTTVPMNTALRLSIVIRHDRASTFRNCSCALFFAS